MYSWAPYHEPTSAFTLAFRATAQAQPRAPSRAINAPEHLGISAKAALRCGCAPRDFAPGRVGGPRNVDNAYRPARLNAKTSQSTSQSSANGQLAICFLGCAAPRLRDMRGSEPRCIKQVLTSQLELASRTLYYRHADISSTLQDQELPRRKWAKPGLRSLSGLRVFLF